MEQHERHHMYTSVASEDPGNSTIVQLSASNAGIRTATKVKGSVFVVLLVLGFGHEWSVTLTQTTIEQTREELIAQLASEKARTRHLQAQIAREAKESQQIRHRMHAQVRGMRAQAAHVGSTVEEERRDVSRMVVDPEEHLVTYLNDLNGIHGYRPASRPRYMSLVQLQSSDLHQLQGTDRLPTACTAPDGSYGRSRPQTLVVHWCFLPTSTFFLPALLCFALQPVLKHALKACS